jgi:hypothetical protein
MACMKLPMMIINNVYQLCAGTFQLIILHLQLDLSFCVACQVIFIALDFSVLFRMKNVVEINTGDNEMETTTGTC